MIVNLGDSWIVQIHRNILEGKEKVNPRDITFFNVELIEKAAKHTLDHIKQCQQCELNKDELLALSRDFPQMLDTIDGRRDFTNRLDSILKHLRVDHKIYPKGYFTGLYSLLGITLGGILGWIISKLHWLSTYAAMVSMLGVGFILGWLWGQIKDKNIARKGKRL